MDFWSWMIVAYAALAVGTLFPTLYAFLRSVPLNSGGASFEDSFFSEEARRRLVGHYSRMQGTLLFWKQSATLSQRFHYYCLFWTIISSTAMPFLTQAIDINSSASRWFLTLVAAHVAVLLAFHRGLKVAERYKAFRHGESEFYDTYRRLLDRPSTFGVDEEKQLTKYFEEVELIRKFVRNAETDTLPNVEDVRDQIAKSNG